MRANRPSRIYVRKPAETKVVGATAKAAKSSRRIVVQTIKTAVVVVLLLGVCYGAYVAMNAPEPVLPPELEAWSAEGGLDISVEDGAAMAIEIPQLSDKKSSPDLSELNPPNISSLESTDPSTAAFPPGASSASDKKTTPALPSLSLPELAGLPAGNNGTSLDSQVLNLPPGLEGNSVPLPGSGSPSGNANVLGNFTSHSNESTAMKGQAGINSPTSNPPGFPTFTGSGAGSATAPKADAPGASASQGTKTHQPYSVAREQALKLANDGKLREALAQMSPYFNHIELTRPEHLDLVDLLDALASEVIYSKRHMLENPFRVGPGDTLEAIANRYHVSPEALGSINGMGDSKVVLAGTQLKVLNGPFRADVNLTRGELTLFLGELYAGRFPISVGTDPAPVEGSFEIVNRRRDRSYVDKKLGFITATDGRNPYGGYWMHLGNELCIHGSAANLSPELSSAGCISLAPLDAREVYTLLTQGSPVTIHR